MPQIMDGKSSRWSLYQTDTVSTVGTGAYTLEPTFATVNGAHGGVFLASLYGVVDPAGSLIIEGGANDDKYIFVYDANPNQADADMKYPRIILPCKSKESFFYDAPWEEMQHFTRWPSDPNVKADFVEGMYAPYNEGIRVYLSSTMDRLTPIIHGKFGITQARSMLCTCS